MMSSPLFQTALYAALALCAAGPRCGARSAWFRIRIGPDVRDVTPLGSVAAALRGDGLDARSAGACPDVFGAFFLDVLLLRRLFATAKLRWLAHLLIVVGFTLLLLMHALAPLVTAQLFPGYQPTLDPYLFLRNLFGAMVLVGVALLFVGRRRSRANPRPARHPTAAVFVALLGCVIASGFLLEAHKIASPRAFDRMAEQFGGGADAAKLEPLRALWAREFGVAFRDLAEPIDPALVEQGRDLHREACAACHARPASAFVSYPVARMMAPVTRFLDRWNAEAWLLDLHVFACLLGLATLPFTRFFHVVASPLGLLVNAATRPGRTSGEALSFAARASQRALALDACVRCGICDQDCSVAPLARYLGNPGLLPSHKLIATAAMASGRLLRSGDDANGTDALRAADGAFLCTDCGRCTRHCPVGLDLEDLWTAGRGDLAAAGLPAAGPVGAGTAGAGVGRVPGGRSRAAATRRSGCRFRAAVGRPPHLLPLRAVPDLHQRLPGGGAQHRLPSDGVDLTPQKVMNLLRLGLRDLTLGSRMVWDCATCYQCQENCPEGIRVTDIMCELRALAVRAAGRPSDAAGRPA